MTDAEQKVFIGRTQELEKLKAFHQKGKAGLVVIKGRRRIGKSRLVEEFARQASPPTFWRFSGLAPQGGMTDQDQRDHFARQFSAQTTLPPLTFQDWNDALHHLSLHLQDHDIVLLDEISWMADKDPAFVSKLKAWWDGQQKAITLVFCGSVSTWIEENILNSTAFFGRINVTITLSPLSIRESAQLLQANGYQGSAYDIYKLLGILGGVPWYLEQVWAGVSADGLISELCFQRDGLLVKEFDRIFHDLFGRKGATYKKILHTLKEGAATLADIRSALSFPHSGTLSELMEHLVVAGFVRKSPLWSFKTGAFGKQSLYHICDPYMRFYLKVIEPKIEKISQGGFAGDTLSQLPGFDAHMGLQIEYLLLENRASLLKAIGLRNNEIVCDGPYRQTTTKAHRGCQIDYLIQTRTHNLFVCEFKFKRREIDSTIIEDLTYKLSALKKPKGYSAIPILFHLGGVTASVETRGFFYRVIDITDFIE